MLNGNTPNLALPETLTFAPGRFKMTGTATGIQVIDHPAPTFEIVIDEASISKND